MNYSIIKDPHALESFIAWLPDTKEGEKYYICLLARNKYVKDLGLGTFNSDRHQCARFLTTKEYMFEKIKQLECEAGSYRVKGITVPQEALALYITPNPRDMIRATRNSLVKFAELVAAGSTNHDPYMEVLSQVHKTPGTKHFVDIDVDGVELTISLRAQMLSYLNWEAFQLLVTRGGFHIIVNLKKIDAKYSKTWYNNMMSIRGVDGAGDRMIPVPGCTQGGFTPTMIY